MTDYSIEDEIPRLILEIQLDASEETRRALEDGDERLADVMCRVRVHADQLAYATKASDLCDVAGCTSRWRYKVGIGDPPVNPPRRRCEDHS